MNKPIFSLPLKTDLIVKRVPLHSEETFHDVCTRYIPSAVSQTKVLSKSYPWGDSPLSISKKIWTYFRNNFEYKLDKAGFEEIRLPSQIANDGVFDCEDSTIFCSSLLINLNIPHTVRMADYGDGWQHIYLKVGKITLDPVDSIFNHEDKGRFMDYNIDPKFIRQNKIWKSKKNTGLGRIGIDPKKAREEGKFVENGIEFERQNDNIVKKYMLRGRDCTVSFTLDIEVNAYYALIPALLLQPSHIGNIENPLHFLPDAQPRNRSMSESGATVPKMMAERLRPSEISEGATAYTGTPIVNERGEVIQGNGRAYAMKYYWQHHKLDERGYMKYLLDHANLYGFDKRPSKIYINDLSKHEFDKSFMYVLGRSAGFGIASPVLVRVVPCTDEQAIILGQYKQSDLEAITTRSNDVKSKVSLITPKLIDSILQSLFYEREDSGATLNELIRNSNVVSLLIRNKVLRSDEVLENYVNKNGELNSDGVRFVSEILVGLIFKNSDTNTPELFRQLPDRVQTALAKSATFILQNPQIQTRIANSVRGTVTYLQFKEMGNSFESWVSQNSIFGKSPREEYSKEELSLIKLFGDAKTQVEIINQLRRLHDITTNETPTGLDFGNQEIRKAQPIDRAFETVFTKTNKSNTTNEIAFVNQLIEDFAKKVKHNKLSLEKQAYKYGIEKSIEIKELTELAIVISARSLANTKGRSRKEKYDAIVELYQNQPNSSLRTSESILYQQYSTPSPIAYLMGLYCGLDAKNLNNGVFYEPSAGNGVLTIAAENTYLFDVNELSPYRNHLLELQEFNKVTRLDASLQNNQISKKYKAVVTNPPFGKIDEKLKFDGYQLGNLDHLMTLRALEAMQDNGKAAIIIGGNTEWDAKGRIQAGKNRVFLSYLYEFYEVDDIINLDSKKLYSRQGTGFNVRVILINGRKKNPSGYAPLFNAQTDTQVKSFEELYSRFEPFLGVTKSKSIKEKALALKYKYQKVLMETIDF